MSLQPVTRPMIVQIGMCGVNRVWMASAVAATAFSASPSGGGRCGEGGERLAVDRVDPAGGLGV